MPYTHPIQQLLRDDPRFKIEAYQFVREALSFAQDILGLGAEPDEVADDDDLNAASADTVDLDDELALDESDFALDDELSSVIDELERESLQRETAQYRPERHLTGQQLCEAIRQYAIQQYGYMAQVVLDTWGIRSTGDLGDIVYNLIRIGLMKKSPRDRREDFENVYDFSRAFRDDFRIDRPEA